MNREVHGENSFAFPQHRLGKGRVFAAGLLARDHTPELRDAPLGLGDPSFQSDKIFQDFVVIHCRLE